MTKSIDEIIRDAIQRGEFDNLANKGKKLNLDDYFNTPEDVRLGYSILKNADYLPEEVQVLKDIGELQDKLVTITLDDERKKIIKEIEALRLKYNLQMERYQRQARH
jgi:hypothetical protein